MFWFLLIFSIDIITYAISYTQIASDVMCVQYVIQLFLHSLQQNIFFFYKELFSVDHGSYLEKIRAVFKHLNQI